MAPTEAVDGATIIRPMAPSAVDEETVERTRESVALMQSDIAIPTKLEANAIGLLAITGTPSLEGLRLLLICAWSF